MGDVSMGRHPLVSRFMRGARRLRPFCLTQVPSWDLSVILDGLSGHPFEPLESVSIQLLTKDSYLVRPYPPSRE